MLTYGTTCQLHLHPPFSLELPLSYILSLPRALELYNSGGHATTCYHGGAGEPP
jgi:hypothetical protein